MDGLPSNPGLLPSTEGEGENLAEIPRVMPLESGPLERHET